MESVNPEEKENDRIITTAVEYAEATFTIEKSVTSGEDLEKINAKLQEQIAGTRFLKDSTELIERFKMHIPRFLARKKLVDGYLQIASDKEGLKSLVEKRLNANIANLSEGQEPFKVGKTYGVATVKDGGFAIGVLIDFQTMQVVSSRFKADEFYGVHVGEGIVLLTVKEGDVIDGKVTPSVADRMTDTMRHENYHALADILGAGSAASKANLRNSEQIYSKKAITPQEIDKLIYDMKRVAKNEIIPEAEINFGAYGAYTTETDQSPKAMTKAAYNFIAHSLSQLIAPHADRLKGAMQNPPEGWNIPENIRQNISKYVDTLADLVYGSLSSFFIARLILRTQDNQRRLFYSASMLQLEDFKFLPAVAGELNKRYPPSQPTTSTQPS